MVSRRAYLIIALSIIITSALGNVVLLFLAASSDGMCHCSDSMYRLFPYSTLLTMNTRLGGNYPGNYLIIFLLFAQYPLYATFLLIVRPVRWKVVIFVLILIAHTTAALLGLRSYGRARGYFGLVAVTASQLFSSR